MNKCLLNEWLGNVFLGKPGRVTVRRLASWWWRARARFVSVIPQCARRCTPIQPMRRNKRPWYCRLRDSCPWCWYRTRAGEVFQRLKTLLEVHPGPWAVRCRVIQRAYPGRSARHVREQLAGKLARRLRKLRAAGGVLWLAVTGSAYGAVAEARWLLLYPGKGRPRTWWTDARLARVVAKWAAYDGRWAVAALRDYETWWSKKRLRFFGCLRGGVADQVRQ